MNLTTAIFQLLLGGAVMLIGGEVLVRGASKLALICRIPALIVGLTIVAACTSAPEMAVSLIGLLGEAKSADIAVGNIVGSNIFNILAILGLSAIVRPIGVSSQLVKQEIPLMIVISAMLGLIGWFFVGTINGSSVHYIPRWFGPIMLLVLLFYNVRLIRAVKKENGNALKSEDLRVKPVKTDKSALVWSIFGAILLLSLGLGMLVYGSNTFIRGAVTTAKICNMSELAISLTILAAGTSLPELVVSLVAAFRGKEDIAIGNVVGSNIFNILAILGLTACLAPGGLPLAAQTIRFDLPVLFISALAGGILCITGHKLTRIEGSVLFLAYIGYVICLFR